MPSLYLYKKNILESLEVGDAHYYNKTQYYMICLIPFLVLNFYWFTLDPFQMAFQHVFSMKLFNCWYTLAIDGISFFFIYLTGLLIFLCVLFNWNNDDKMHESMVCLLSIEFLLVMVFCVVDLLLFYILFEAILIPFFIFIGIMGYRKRRIHAAYLLFFYTLTGSFFMLVGLITLYLNTGSTNVLFLQFVEMPFQTELFIWICFFFSFAIKIPIFPFHIWLPEAHVEAPTEGSVLLAGVLLKLGTYGFLRFIFPILPNASYYFSPLVLLLSSLGVLYASLTTLRQIDIKRIIAYSSVAHMNLCIIGLFNFDVISFVGSVLLMIGHGIVSGGLFFLIGILYKRYHTKLIYYYSGMVYTMPLFSTFFFLFTLGNISMPGTSNFLGELLILNGLVIQLNFLLVIIVCLGIFLGTIYSMWLYNKINFGLPYYNFYKNIVDISYLEFFILSILWFFVLWIGLYPKQFIDLLYPAIIYNNLFLIN